MFLNYNSTTIEYDIIRSNRKTISISILPAKKVIVRAPSGLSDNIIGYMVEKKADWIYKKIAYMPDYKTDKSQKNCENGDKLFYRGIKYQLHIVKDNRIKDYKIELDNNKLTIFINSNIQKSIPQILVSWYKQKAKELVNERITYYKHFFNKKINKITIKNQKRRWGSCSSLGNLNFNFRIAMLPDTMLDYIIVHEMCHLIYLNHSKDFWRSVEAILPDYKAREQWIKLNTAMYDFGNL